MNGFSRRSAVVGAIALGASLSAPVRAWSGVDLPPGPMRLSRRVERGMRGGVSIVVERAWAVQFARQASGIAVSGRQTSAKVDAPASLAQLAQIEEGRSTDGMWPILLGKDGAIMASGSSLRPEDLAQAVREAERMIGQRPASADIKAAQLQSLALLQGSAGKLLDQLPRDLFYPASPPVRTVEPVNLGEGLTGEFELNYSAIRSPGHAWLERAERRVTTRIGASERLSREVWEMTEI